MGECICVFNCKNTTVPHGTPKKSLHFVLNVCTANIFMHVIKAAGIEDTFPAAQECMPIGSLAKIRFILEQQDLHHKGMNLTVPVCMAPSHDV